MCQDHDRLSLSPLFHHCILNLLYPCHPLQKTHTVDKNKGTAERDTHIRLYTDQKHILLISSCRPTPLIGYVCVRTLPLQLNVTVPAGTILD